MSSNRLRSPPRAQVRRVVVVLFGNRAVPYRADGWSAQVGPAVSSRTALRAQKRAGWACAQSCPITGVRKPKGEGRRRRFAATLRPYLNPNLARQAVNARAEAKTGKWRALEDVPSDGRDFAGFACRGRLGARWSRAGVTTFLCCQFSVSPRGPRWWSNAL